MTYKVILIAIYLASASGFVTAAECTRHKLVDPEFPAGLIGKYDVVGRDLGTGKPYAGSVTLGSGTRSYSVRRVVGTHVQQGEAWLQTCGLDKIRSIRISYQTKPKPSEFVCAFNSDGDNYYRLTCKSFSSGKAMGLEAWFQTE